MNQYDKKKSEIIRKTKAGGERMKALGYNKSDRKKLTKHTYDIRKRFQG